MNKAELVNGLMLVGRYMKNPDGCFVGADHDKIYTEPTDWVMKDEDLDNMIAWGWFQNGREDPCGDFRRQDYDQEEGWIAFV